MDERDLCFLTAGEVAPLLRRKEISPVALTTAVLGRIAAVGPGLNAYLTVTADSALAAARQAEREIMAGEYRGPLHGVPVSLKDLYYTQGVRTTGGSKILVDFVPDYDAAAVERLRAAGAVIVGKTNMHEFAYGADNLNPHFGPAVNPWDHACITGGSSGGSAAAVASGLCAASLGSDTGGSIRIPSACCGTVGLKPTYGLVSRYGVLPLSWSQDTVGPLTRSVADAAMVLNALAGHDPRDPASAQVPVADYTAGLDGEVRGLRLGVPRDYFFAGLEPEVRQLIAAACDVLVAAGATLVEVALPRVAEGTAAGATILFAEAAAYHAPWFRTRPDDYGADVRGRIERGSLLLATDYIQAQRTRAVCCADFEQVFRQVDALVAPTLPMAAPRRDQAEITLDDRVEDTRTALTRFTRLFNVLGVPTIAVPCGFTTAGLPASLQIAAPPFAEQTVLRLAYAYEARTKWRPRRPPD